MRWLILTGALALVTAGCGQPQNYVRKAAEKLNVYDVESTTAGPQIAYSYSLTYTLGDAAIAATQARVVALCRGMGIRRCTVVETNLNSVSDDGGSASVDLLVDARIAGRFQQRLDRIATDAGGAPGERHVTAEDVTRQIIDTDARVRAKQALADRLLDIIRTANGRVGDLVAAEKAYAEVQEQLDAARGQRAELGRRVAMSKIAISFTSARATGTWAPVTRATSGIGETFAASIAALLTFVIAAIPWALLLALVVWLVRRTGWRPRWPFRRRVPPVANP